MRASDKAVVINAVKYGDKKHIVKLYTRSHGLVTAAAAVGHSQKSRVRPAAIMPLTFIDANFSARQNKEVQVLTEASVYFKPELSGNISKLAIAQFINEVLVKCIREQVVNERLFDFIEHCFDFLNRAETGYNDVHIYFMRELAKHNGFDPQNNYSRNYPYFDCREGVFSPVSLPYPIGLEGNDSALFSAFLESPFLGRKWSGMERQHILESLIAYYTFHVPSFSELKSVQVLREVLAG
jgi:DNA repair protein RecO (recombination protein O)